MDWPVIKNWKKSLRGQGKFEGGVRKKNISGLKKKKKKKSPEENTT